MSRAILYPLFALSGWTFLILVLIAYRRIGAGLAGRVKPADFRFGESACVPPEVCLPNRNYMNLLELPVLFYVVGLIGFVTGQHSALQLGLAWAYV
ncbi:MAG: MAPEG family protein, partial [Zoogloea sp.]|nr:MAPEG family protein [Zoogloea sp.]